MRQGRRMDNSLRLDRQRTNLSLWRNAQIADVHPSTGNATVSSTENKSAGSNATVVRTPPSVGTSLESRARFLSDFRFRTFQLQSSLRTEKLDDGQAGC